MHPPRGTPSRGTGESAKGEVGLLHNLSPSSNTAMQPTNHSNTSGTGNDAVAANPQASNVASLRKPVTTRPKMSFLLSLPAITHPNHSIKGPQEPDSARKSQPLERVILDEGNCQAEADAPLSSPEA